MFIRRRKTSVDSVETVRPVASPTHGRYEDQWEAVPDGFDAFSPAEQAAVRHRQAKVLALRGRHSYLKPL